MSDQHRILDLVNKPQDIKSLSCEELQILASEVREEIIEVTSKNGGHVSSSLGAVEIILAVHSLIDSPKDKLIFDVGHQSYAHKIITGRKDAFKTLRQFGGISGFIKPTESEHDVHFSGHASDSLSIAMGLAKAKKLNNGDEKIVTVIGDASIAGGMSFEAINQIGHENLPMVIILNDNNMSISASVGGFMDHLTTMRLNSSYKNARNTVLYSLKRFGSFGDFAIKWGHASKESLKHLIMPDAILFEELGITCMPSVDGHDICALRNSLRKAFSYDGPVLIHARTHKGAGYEPALKDPELFHGIGAYDIKTGKPLCNNDDSYTSVFSDELVKLAKKDERIVAMTAAMSGGTGLKKFQKEFPKRFIDVGIAEEHLVGIATGLAKNGYKPVVAVYSAFLQRAIDQMIINVALENLDVVFCIDRAGIVGPDGVSHHGLFDISYCSMIPNLTIIAPSSALELRRALHTAFEMGGPFAIRYPRGKAADFDIKKTNKNINSFSIGKSRTLKKGSDVSILAFGACVKDALEAHETLKERDIKARVIDMRFIKPLDVKAITKAVKDTGKIVVVEDGVISGGAGSAVLQEIAKSGLLKQCCFKNLGVDDTFVTHGDVDKLKATVHIDSKSIVDAVASLID